MEVTRTELLPGVFLTHLRTDKFKTACLSVNLLTQLNRETAAMNALIPAGAPPAGGIWNSSPAGWMSSTAPPSSR